MGLVGRHLWEGWWRRLVGSNTCCITAATDDKWALTTLHCNSLLQCEGYRSCSSSKCGETLRALHFVKPLAVGSLIDAPVGRVVEEADGEVPCRERTSQMQAVPFLQPDAKKRPSWLKARCHTSSVCCLSTCMPPTQLPSAAHGISIQDGQPP